MKKKCSTFVTYLLLVLGAAVMILPFYWMIVSSMKNASEIATMPPTWLPSSFNLENFKYAFEQANFGRYFLNSLIVMAISVLLTLLITVLTAFAFSRLKFPGRDLIFALLMGLMMVPFELIAISNYATIVELQKLDTYFALTVPYTANVMYTYILRNSFLGIPDSLYYAARIDGASNWQYLWKIMFRISKPAIMTIVLLNGIDSWNSFFWPMLVTNAPDMRTVTVGLTTFVQAAGIRYERLMAAATIVVLPMLVLFLFARKSIITAISRGGIKG